MLVAVDIGNTNIVLGFLDGDTIAGTYRITTKANHTSAEYGLFLTEFLRMSGFQPSDFGTATTFTHVSDKGVVDSGVITTGIRAGAAALWGDTAQLPEVEITRPDTILGTNTKTCMQAGLYYTFLGGVERTIRQFRKELGGEDFKVITTGGLGRVFENDTELIDVYDPDLIFKGMAHIYSRNVK